MLCLIDWKNLVISRLRQYNFSNASTVYYKVRQNKGWVPLQNTPPLGQRWMQKLSADPQPLLPPHATIFCPSRLCRAAELHWSPKWSHVKTDISKYTLKMAAPEDAAISLHASSLLGMAPQPGQRTRTRVVPTEQTACTWAVSHLPKAHQTSVEMAPIFPTDPLSFVQPCLFCTLERNQPLQGFSWTKIIILFLLSVLFCCTGFQVDYHEREVCYECQYLTGMR